MRERFEVMPKDGRAIPRYLVDLRHIRGDGLSDVSLGGGMWFLDPKFLHAGSQRVGMKAESRRRTLLPFDHPIDLLKDQGNMGAFSFFERA